MIGEKYGLWGNSILLDVDNFQDKVLEDRDHAWFITYLHPTCPGCKKLVPEWEEVRNSRNIGFLDVKFGYLDITNKKNQDYWQNKFSAGHKIAFTPTLLFYGKNKSKATEYEGNYKENVLN